LQAIEVLTSAIRDFLRIFLRTSVTFWADPDVGVGAKIITSGFALLMIGLARWEMLRTTNLQDFLTLAAKVILLIFVAIAIAVAMDRNLNKGAVGDTLAIVEKGVRTVFVTSILGCFFIWLNGFVSWLDVVSNDRLIVGLATLLGFFVVCGNTVTRVSQPSSATPSEFVSPLRYVVWGIVLLVASYGALGIVVFT
jgi:hypothetical protein